MPKTQTNFLLHFDPQYLHVLSGFYDCLWRKIGFFCADLVVPVLLQEVSGHVAGQDVPKHVLVVFSQLLHLVDLLFGLDAPQEV